MEQTIEAQREQQCLEEIAYNVMGQYRKQIAGDDTGGGAMLAAQELARRFLTVRPDTFAHNPSADALDKLWQDVILAHKPDYGDWEYPGMAYRHIRDEHNEVRQRLAAAEAERDRMQDHIHAVEERNRVWTARAERAEAERDRLAAALREGATLLQAARTALETGDHLYPAWVQRTDAWLALHPQQEPSDGK